MMYIINADDFGHSASTNSAIRQCFTEGWVSSTTIMANMPGFDDACQMVAEHNLNNRVGLHMVLTEGGPLTDRIKRHRRFCTEEGMFCTTRKTRLIHLSTDEREAVSEELRMQIERCRKNGLKLTHVDSHHHIHEEMAIISLVVPLIREFAIPYVRIMNNMADSCAMTRKTYATIYNAFLKCRKLNRTDYFGSLDEYVAFAVNHSVDFIKGKRFEIMAHPISNGEGIVVEKLSNRPMGQSIEHAGLRWRGRSFSGAIYAVDSADV